MRAAAALALFSFLAQVPAARTVTLALPHALRAGESATLLVSVGVIPKGARIEVTTPSGHPLGTISPHGIRPGSEAGTYTVPLPSDAIDGRHVCVLLSLAFGDTRRAPSEKEVKGVRVRIS
ncbi:MAG TPA: hypothetical protein VII75_06905 [Thermoanaerobaculia bacterium]